MAGADDVVVVLTCRIIRICPRRRRAALFYLFQRYLVMASLFTVDPLHVACRSMTGLVDTKMSSHIDKWVENYHRKRGYKSIVPRTNNQ
jgi:hypothetical protein